MSIGVKSRPLLACDGCRSEFGMDLFADHALELRCMAYAEGWRFPSKRSHIDGSAVPNRHHDVCPACVQGFVPEVLRPNEPSAAQRRRAEGRA